MTSTIAQDEFAFLAEQTARELVRAASLAAFNPDAETVNGYLTTGVSLGDRLKGAFGNGKAAAPIAMRVTSQCLDAGVAVAVELLAPDGDSLSARVLTLVANKSDAIHGRVLFSNVSIKRVPVDPGEWTFYELGWDNAFTAVILLASRQDPSSPHAPRDITWSTNQELTVVPGFEYLMHATGISEAPSGAITIKNRLTKTFGTGSHAPVLEDGPIGATPRLTVDQRATGGQWAPWPGNLTLGDYTYFSGDAPVAYGVDETLVIGIKHDGGDPLAIEDIAVLMKEDSVYTMLFGGLPAMLPEGASIELLEIDSGDVATGYKGYSYKENQLT